jgi:hypothetical protein
MLSLPRSLESKAQVWAYLVTRGDAPFQKHMTVQKFRKFAVQECWTRTVRASG